MNIEDELCFTCLRKKRPPQELGSWDEIAKLTRWNPLREQMPA